MIRSDGVSFEDLQKVADLRVDDATLVRVWETDDGLLHMELVYRKPGKE